MEFMIIYLLLVQLFYMVSSDPPNSKLYENSLCQNCTLEVRLRHLELLVEKLLAMNSADQSVNWLNNFAFGLASAVTGFGFNLVVALFGIYYTYRINKKFKNLERVEELRYQCRLERMQFPLAADHESAMLPERW